MKKYVPIIGCILVIVCWQCTKDDQNLTLKESVQQSVDRINMAFAEIAVSKGYQILSVTEEGTKTDDSEGFRDSIDLDMISGIYDFNPDFEMPMFAFFHFRLFSKTSTDEKLIINMPEKLAFHPRYLHFCNVDDSDLENNFTISASDYHFYYTGWNNTDYELAADLTLDGDDIGSMNVVTKWKSGTEGTYLKKYTFPEGYSIVKNGATGEPTKLVFALLEETDTLLSETLVFSGDGFKRREKTYILSIGNVDIKRTTGIDSMEVYLDGVLQQTAAALIIDNDNDYNSSICHKRDILLTFDDGTTARLSEMIGPAMETMKTVSRALGEMYFSKHIIDYIAFSIYYCNKE
jgi:hypothetical protein